MLPFKFIFLAALFLIILSGATATWIAMAGRGNNPSRQKVAERLAQIALLGAAAIFALLGGLTD